jgi:WD40 repeat protein
LDRQQLVATNSANGFCTASAGCISVDFHPFGEYFASGSLDANLKIW